MTDEPEQWEPERLRRYAHNVREEQALLDVVDVLAGQVQRLRSDEQDATRALYYLAGEDAGGVVTVEQARDIVDQWISELTAERDIAREVARWAWQQVPADKQQRVRASAQRNGVWPVLLDDTNSRPGMRSERRRPERGT